jgi:hypothetical protein
MVVSRIWVGSTFVMETSWRLVNAAVLSSPSSNIVVTTVLKRLDLDKKISKEGRAESGVCRLVRVVNGTICRSNGSGPVTVGYSPVQYEIVVVMLGDGKTKLTAASPNDITFVTARARDKDVSFKLEGDGDVTIGEVVVVNVNVEVGVPCETTLELGRDTDAVVSVWMLKVPLDDVKLLVKELESTVEVVVVTEINSAEEVVEFLFIEDEEFVLGNRVGKPIEVLGASMLAKDVLKDSNDGVELEVRTEVCEEVDGTESDRVKPVGSVIEELSTLLVRTGFRLVGVKLLDKMPELVTSDEVRLLDDVTEELPILLVKLRLAPSRLEVLDDTPTERDDPGEGFGGNTVKPSLRVGETTEELPTIVVPVETVVKPSDRLAIKVVGALEVNSRLDSRTGCEDMPPDILKGRFGFRLDRLLDRTTDERLVLVGVENVEGKRKVDSVVTVVESPLLIVTTVVDTKYDGYGLCGWLIGRRKLDVSDDVGPNGGRLTDDKANEEGEGLLPETLVPTDDRSVEPEVSDDVNSVSDPGVEGPGIDSALVVDVCVDDTVAAPEEDVPVIDNEETRGVISAVWVTRVLKRLGGAMLLSHSVVPLMTEK